MGVSDVFVLCYFQRRQVNLSLRRWCSSQTASTRLNIRPGSQVSFHACFVVERHIYKLAWRYQLDLNL